MKKRWTTLWALARCPFLSADDLALLLATSARTARARLLRLCRAHLVEYIQVPGTHEHLYYLSPAGIAAAARAAETTPEALATRYGLGERALMRRLPALDRLRAGRRVLFSLHHALAACGGALEEWRAWPVPWGYRLGDHRRLLYLDGEGIMRLPHGRTEPWPFGFLWDGEATVPAAILAERLEHLDLVRRAEEAGPNAASVPPVLVVTAGAERVPTAYRPDLLWTTTEEVGRHGILAASWHGSSLQGDALPLAEALATLGRRPPSYRAEAAIPDPDSIVDHDGGGRPLQLQRRVHAARRRAGEESLSLLALALPPRSFPLLDLIGRHPFLSLADVAQAAEMSPVDTRATLALLRRHSLARTWTLPRDRRTRRHVLTRRGLRLLALRVGVAPETYRRIYGVLDDAAETARRALDFARVNLAHTDGINRLYLALLGTARAAGGTLQWRGEWACTRPYLDGPHRRTLRPDADGVYTDRNGILRFFVEVDRGTTQMWYLATKLEQYARYRDQVTLLLVTTGPGRSYNALRANDALACAGTAPLDLRVTTLAELRARGAQARFWCSVSQTCDPLRPCVEAATRVTAVG